MEYKTCKQCGESKSLDLFYRDSRSVSGRKSKCKSCQSVLHAEFHKRNKEKYQALGKIRRSTEEYREKHRIKILESYYRDKSGFFARNAKRKASKLKATPVWSDLVEIRNIYKLSVLMSNSSGLKYHVDHILPLQGKSVCGLHIPSNLRIIPQVDNLSKNNKFDADMHSETLYSQLSISLNGF